MKAVREFIATLSKEWQQKIELRVNGGLDPFFEKKEDNYYYNLLLNGHLNDSPIESEYKVVDEDSDLPAQANGGFYTSCAA